MKFSIAYFLKDRTAIFGLYASKIRVCTHSMGIWHFWNEWTKPIFSLKHKFATPQQKSGTYWDLKNHKWHHTLSKTFKAKKHKRQRTWRYCCWQSKHPYFGHLGASQIHELPFPTKKPLEIINMHHCSFKESFQKKENILL